jgi:hypothetical protein
MFEDLKKTKVAIIDDNTGYGVLGRGAATRILAQRNVAPVYTASDPWTPLSGAASAPPRVN